MELKDRILKVADDICNRIGFRAMTMDDLALKLGISKKTLYQYYEDKEALVDAVITDEMESKQNDCTICSEIAVDAVDEIFLLLEMMSQNFKNLNPVIVNDLQKYFPSISKKFMEFKNQYYYKVVSDNLKRGISEGLYRSDINIDVLTKYRLECAMIPFNQEVFPSNKYDLTLVTREFVEHFLHGIVTEKGYELILKYKNSKGKQI